MNFFLGWTAFAEQWFPPFGISWGDWILGMIILGVAWACFEKIFEARAALEAAAKLEAAKKKYQTALNTLQSNKTAANRVKALEAGRAYCALARDQEGTAIFDEAMLKNDLDAYGA
jgi:hypothetical protein